MLQNQPFITAIYSHPRQTILPERPMLFLEKLAGSLS